MPRLAREHLVVLVPMFAMLVVARGALAQDAGNATDLINPDRPGIADGSRVLGRFGVQVEFGVQQEFRDADHMKSRDVFLPTLVRIGFGPRFEGRIEANDYTWTHTDDPTASAPNTSGFAPWSGGFKYALTDNCYQVAGDCGHLRHSFGAIVRVFPRSGTRDDASHHLTADARLAADWDLSDKFSLNPNVGIARYESGDRKTYAAGLMAVTLNYEPSPTVNPFVDAGYQVPAGPGQPGSLTVDGGLAWIVCSNVQLDVSVGGGSRNSAPRPFWSVGLSIRKLKPRPHRR